MKLVEIKSLTTFQWKTHANGFIPVTNMSTAHLYNTVKMVWNNCVEKHLRFPNAKLYKFGNFYTTAYMKSAIRNMAQELQHRTNLTSAMKRGLNFMTSNLKHSDINECSTMIENKGKLIEDIDRNTF